MNKSYCNEIRENLTTFVTECIFVSYKIRERRGKQTIAFLAVTWLTIFKGHKTEARRNIKNKFDFGVVLWVTHSWQRGPMPVFYEDPLYCSPTPLFQILFPLPPFPCHLQPPPPLLFLLPCFFGWMGDRTTFDVLSYLTHYYPLLLNYTPWKHQKNL